MSKKNKRIRNLLFLIIFCFVIISLVSETRKTDCEQSFSNLLFSSLASNFSQNSLIEVRQNPYEPLPVVLVQKDSIIGISAPVIISPQILGAYAGGYGPTDFNIDKEIREYIVQEGDSLSSIADQFNISENTIKWVNNLSSSGIKPNQKLTILPVSGAFHLVRKDDTLSEIAVWYKADISEIMEYNDISSAEKIVAGDILIIPNGTKPLTLPSPRTSTVAGTSFAYPVPAPIRITQGLHHYNAIDFGAPCGTPVYASESGTIQRTGYSAVGGNYVRILHANGIVTYYGHLQSHNFVRPGQKVSRGQVIGHIGLTGYTTGCHVHFEFRSPTGARNPFAR
ncbi:MAG: LysM peptidoglycan-binding domain-containing protein [Candidatus Pacebacteria bacterium]|nr:LysM peptidoglycan-binding domain-containing protein [Candidatus Paceibacterota bacterium]